MLGYYEVLTSGSEPLSLTDAKTFLRVQHTADDDVITAMIKAARLSGEKLTGQSFIARTWRASFPASCGTGNEIMQSPVTSITSVKEWDPDTQAYVAVSDTVFTPSNFGFGWVEYPAVIPKPTDKNFGVQVEFAGGYSTLPDDLLSALKMHVAFLYENRGDVEAIDGVKIPRAAEFIYRQYRIVSCYG